MILVSFSKLKPQPQYVSKSRCAGYLERSAWWNSQQICSELLLTTRTSRAMHQSWRETFWTFD